MHRIVFVTGIYPPDIGGPATAIPSLAAGVSKYGVESSVVTLGSTSTDTTDLTRIPRGLPLPIRFVRTVAAIARRARRSDVIFANGLGLEAVFAARITRRPLLIKVVGDVVWERAFHDGLTFTLPDFQKTSLPSRYRARRWLRNWWLRSADRIIVPSQFLVPIVISWGVQPSKVSVVRNAANVNLGLPRQLPPDRPTVCFVGRLIKLKRIDAIMRAVAQLPGVSLRIIGDGPEAGPLQALARELGIDQRVTFEGGLAKSEVFQAMRGSTCLVINSVHETFPHVALEAMAAGLPVVATAAGGTTEIVHDGETGILIPIDDQPALVAALKRIIEDRSLWMRLSSNGQDYVRNSFTEEQTTRATLAEIGRLMPPAPAFPPKSPGAVRLPSESR